MKSFFNLLIKSCAAKGLLTGDQALLENIENWIGAMSSAGNRPFRHTATFISLEIINALAELGHSALSTRAKIVRQAEGEKKSRKVNKSRVNDVEASAEEAAERAEQIDQFIQNWFDVVFVHRYRDVDPRIRVDCISYLSEWIWTYPEHFLDSAHLRYLGWLLSDTQAPTRLQVVRDLQRLFKDDTKITNLRQFTERFRPRMVEMAGRDGDLNVRCACVELLDVLREKGLLEPDDVDTIGRLAFDTEARIRKAVAPFFAANVEDVYEAKVSEFDSVEVETLQDFERDENDEDFETEKLDWLRFKGIAELLRSYDYSEEETTRLIDLEASAINDTAEPVHSRISLAAENLMDDLPCLKYWETLTGYLLKDIQHHEAIQEDDVPAHIDNQCLLEPAEEAVLLDVLNVAVKHALTSVTQDQPVKKSKKTKTELQLVAEAQETAAQRLASLIPRLLRKFGSQPESASAVLRLEHLLNLDIFAQLREDSTTYATLLEDINRQFMQHEDASVIISAKRALLHAKSFDELQEITDGKLAALWDDTAVTLTRLCRGEEMKVRGSLSASIVTALSSTALRIANLASISDATEPLETARSSSPSSSRKKSSQSPEPIVPITCLLDIIGRGVLSADTELDDDTAAAEDLLVDHALSAITFYIMWRLSTLRSSTMPYGTSVTDLRDRATTLSTILRRLVGSRRGADPLRVKSAETLLELAALFSTVRTRAQEDPKFADHLDINSLSRLPTQACTAVLSTFSAVERDFARKANKTLIDPREIGEDTQETQEAEDEEVEAEPESSDDEADEPAEDDGGGGTGEARKQRKQRALLLAEQSLCQLAGKMVLAVAGGCVERRDFSRLERNRGRLGRNFADVVSTLDPSAKEKAGQRKAVKRAVKDKGKKSAAVVEEEGEVVVLLVCYGEEDLGNRVLLYGVGEEEEAPRYDGVGGEEESVLGD